MAHPDRVKRAGLPRGYQFGDGRFDVMDRELGIAIRFIRHFDVKRVTETRIGSASSEPEAAQ